MAQEQVNVKTPEYVSLQFQLAGLGSRATAQIIDYTIIAIVEIILLLLIIFSGINDFILFDEGIGYAIAFYLIITLLLQFGYFIFLEYFWSGRTIGKRMLNIRVIQENGHNITFLSSIIRNFLRVVDMLPFGYLVGMIMIFSHQKHKRLGDLTAGTIVVHERANKSNRLSPLEKYIQKKNLQKEELAIDAFHLKQFTNKDWRLLSTYCSRLPDIKQEERTELTRQIADILLPKIESEVASLHRSDEDILLLLYLHLKEEWEF
ncbi:RDD family protein [Gracilibacillus dipsosauri]|uniref:RDD domain-containing protein n=1 Tax=Gracilibacillus dipsosauri TaxID=178340 RepID=A0A317KXZ7_9BACI|nr:RDD family protein [Gracilibacillus dipsosauri]PWU67984.1 hypothetical protein DLJ74_12845 [Gracilibacillus dipsosauri]